jgi:hypothetical protein
MSASTRADNSGLPLVFNGFVFVALPCFYFNSKDSGAGEKSNRAFAG